VRTTVVATVVSWVVYTLTSAVAAEALRPRAAAVVTRERRRERMALPAANPAVAAVVVRLYWLPAVGWRAKVWTTHGSEAPSVMLPGSTVPVWSSLY